MLQKLKSKLEWLTNRFWWGVREAVHIIWTDTKAEGYVDTGVKIIISVVIGGLLLTGLYALFQSTILPGLETKIQELFSYGS